MFSAPYLKDGLYFVCSVPVSGSGHVHPWCLKMLLGNHTQDVIFMVLPQTGHGHDCFTKDVFI